MDPYETSFTALLQDYEFTRQSLVDQRQQLQRIIAVGGTVLLGGLGYLASQNPNHLGLLGIPLGFAFLYALGIFRLTEMIFDGYHLRDIERYLAKFMVGDSRQVLETEGHRAHVVFSPSTNAASARMVELILLAIAVLFYLVSCSVAYVTIGQNPNLHQFATPLGVTYLFLGIALAAALALSQFTVKVAYDRFVRHAHSYGLPSTPALDR